MALSLKHKFFNPKLDGNDTAKVRPSNWNDEHALTLDSGFVVGKLSAGNGPAEQLTFAQIVAAGGAAGGALMAANNLGDLVSASAARTALGLDPSHAITTLGLGFLATLNAPLDVAHGGTGAGSAAGARANLGVRTVLTATTTYYVSTTGSDFSDGLTNGTPWRTFAHAIAFILGQIDFGGQEVILKIASGSGTFSETLFITSGWTGGGAFTIDGGGGTINPAVGQAIYLTGVFPGGLQVQNITINGSPGGGGNVALYMNGIGFVNIGPGMKFAATPNGTHISIGNGSVSGPQGGSYEITGDASNHVFCSGAGVMFIGNQTIVATAPRHFSQAFLFASTGGVISTGNNVYPAPGNIVGSKYAAVAGGIITGAASIPGTQAGFNDGTGIVSQ